MEPYFVFLITFLSIWGNNHMKPSNAGIFTLKMHHRFSEPVKKWSEGINKHNADDFPEKGSVDYYSQLADRDRMLHGRRISDSGDQRITFSDGNSSIGLSYLGHLHYTTISLGTPGQKLMVALDTGSDLFWVPCDCVHCASIDIVAYSFGFKVTKYSPSASSTSKKVPCNHSVCAPHFGCAKRQTSNTCPYSITYVSHETSTSGFLIEDLLHLETEDGNEETADAFIIFGCGQVQTGALLVAAPNGLFGLGMGAMSVPSILSGDGYIANSFSMCFGHDGNGRISFGDKGVFDQDETPFSHDASSSVIPSMSLTMKGDGRFFIYDPIIILPGQREFVYCLAVMKSPQLNIIGQNFMTGYRIVFDREKLVLGWKKSNCYEIEHSKALKETGSRSRPHSHTSIASPFHSRRWRLCCLIRTCHILVISLIFSCSYSTVFSLLV